MDLDDINWLGVIFGIVGAIIAIIVAQKMGNTLVPRLFVGAIVGVVCYFVGGKVSSA